MFSEMFISLVWLYIYFYAVAMRFRNFNIVADTTVFHEF